MRQTWKDPRLAYPDELVVSNLNLDNIWVPDTYFENAKHSHFHSVTVDNKMLRVKPTGLVHYNARYVSLSFNFIIDKAENLVGVTF